ncbi:hypothetical protein LY76DRAFT_653939, partial [Colletotrichum caudatum]
SCFQSFRFAGLVLDVPSGVVGRKAFLLLVAQQQTEESLSLPKRPSLWQRRAVMRQRPGMRKSTNQERRGGGGGAGLEYEPRLPPVCVSTGMLFRSVRQTDSTLYQLSESAGPSHVEHETLKREEEKEESGSGCVRRSPRDMGDGWTDGREQRW